MRPRRSLRSLNVAPANESGGERRVGEVDVGASRGADRETARAAKSGEHPLHRPAMPTQARCNPLRAWRSEPRSCSQEAFATAWQVIGPVRLELSRTHAYASAQISAKGHCVGQIHQDAVAVHDRIGAFGSKRDAVLLRGDVTPQAQPTTIRRLEAGALAPVFAATPALSKPARLRSIVPNRPS